ncbi:MAG: condensation domain-containing protein, partial [Oscillospiraceae bacterium]|nr:condensation domain-containing protein [Oscillospiraceae bacterium]
TNEKFIDNPYGDGKLYRSGDLVRWLPDGNVQLIGRMDEQVKIRGYRIELGEIGSVLNTLEGIQDSAVIVREDHSGGKSICAYIVSEEEIDVSTIRDALKDKLPDYMIPAYIAHIDSIPMTSNGKLDRRALPAIEAKSDQEYVAPRTATEEAIAEAFEEVLGLERVGVNDSFFEIGGDSIKAIRIVSRLRNSNIEVSIREIMDGKTVEAIALVARAGVSEMVYEQGEITGEVEKTPIIESFNEWNLKKPWHFNQSFVIETAVSDAAIIKIVLDEIVLHHDILRAVYRNNQLKVLGSSESKMYELTVCDLEGEQNIQNRIETECSKIQCSMDLENGPLFKAGLFTSGKSGWIVFVAHHLVVDGVSWRILLDDFDIAINQAIAGEKIQLPPKTASFKLWSEAINEYKGSNILAREKKYWEDVAQKTARAKLQIHDINTKTGYKRSEVLLSREMTANLQYSANRAFNTEINDLLLSALGIAVNKVSGQSEISVMMEGHGREEIHKPIQTDRTVGWFTSMYPIIVDCRSDIRDSIISTKEMLRNIPNNGIGYGLLKSELSEVVADIYFNFLGEMNMTTDNLGALENISIGRDVSEENLLPGSVQINGVIRDKELVVEFNYDCNKYPEESINEFAEIYVQSLSAIITFCCNSDEVVLTGSDYGDATLKMEEIEELSSILDLDI